MVGLTLRIGHRLDDTCLLSTFAQRRVTQDWVFHHNGLGNGQNDR